ncbi:hypothetical protein GINT2_000842 [Glugoides intestinalis]
MRNLPILEASRYASQLLPLKSDVYRNGSSFYSNFRTLLLNKESSIPKMSALKSGVLPEIQAFWYVTQNKLVFTLHIFRYELNSLEVIPDFPSSICFVKAFKPTKGIFNSKIQHCLLVVTETDLIVYGVEADTHSIINTDFSAKLASKATCLGVKNGKIFIGCQNGNIYQAVCKSIDFLNYKYLSLYTPSTSLFKTLTFLFNKKKEPIFHISAGQRFLVAISSSIEVYNVEYGAYKLYDIPLDQTVKYTNVQIVEESPILFYCAQSSGKRDFYTTAFLFSKDPAVVESSDLLKMTFTTESHFLSIRSCFERSTLVLSSFNEDQLRNFSKTKPVENYEVQTIYNQGVDATISENGLFILTPTSVIHYLILDAKRFLLNCKIADICKIYTNYGDVEFMVKYFQLLTENEDVSKLDGLCKNESIKTHALFVWLYTLIKPIWTVDLYTLKSIQDQDRSCELLIDEIIRKLKILKSRLSFGYDSARDFIDEFIQTNFYTTLLADYNIFFKETFESILTQESDFKTFSLKTLLDAFGINQSIEPLLKTMQNNCPIYLPLDNINLQRGLLLIKKDDRDSLMRSLSYLSQSKFDLEVINKFNEVGFYYGSIFLIREKFDFSYEETVELFKQSLKCKGAFDYCLQDTRESFLYPFFEAAIQLETFSSCVCCDSLKMEPDLLSITNPLFKLFLKENLTKNENVCNVYWKYLLVRHEKIEAIEALINFSQRPGFSLDKKVDFLQTALPISAGTHLNSEIKLRIKLYEIQKELMRRSTSFHTTTLLDSDTLYNDYCCEYPDLKIKVLDAIGYKDENVFKSLFVTYFNSHSLQECFLFLAELTNKKIETVFDSLISKITTSTVDFCTGLVMAGFDYEEIIKEVKKSLDSNIHPEVKIELLKSLKLFSKFNEYSECEKNCEKNFGIRVNK